MMKRILALVLCLAILIAPVYAHRSSGAHVNDCKLVLNGYGDSPEFVELAREISKGTDSFYKEYGISLGPNEHRIFGHGWALNDSIPAEVLEEFERTHPGQKEAFIEAWQGYMQRTQQLVMKATGLPKAQAMAFASLLHSIHLLGDFEPDNRALRHVLTPEEIVNNIYKDVEILFKNNPEYAEKVRKALKQVLAECKGMDPQLVAQRLMDKLMTLDIGGKLQDCLGNTLSLTYSEECAVAAKAKVDERIAQRTPLPEKRVISIAKKIARGMGEGLGLAVFEWGIETYRFACSGSIGFGEYERNMYEAGIKGAVTGLALAANPFGYPFVVGMVVYVAADFAVEAARPGYAGPEDLPALGIRPAQGELLTMPHNAAPHAMPHEVAPHALTLPHEAAPLSMPHEFARTSRLPGF